MGIYVKKDSNIARKVVDYNDIITCRQLTSTIDGMLTFPSVGMRLVFGSYPFNGLTSDSASGGYTADIDLSTFNFLTSGSMWGLCQARYAQGLPKCCINKLTYKTLTLFGDTAVKQAYILWCVLGPYAD